MNTNETLQNNQPRVDLVRVFVKGISLETNNFPEIFQSKMEPKISIDLNTSFRALEKNYYEVVLTVTLTMQNNTDNKTIFLLEAQQASIFDISGFDEQKLHEILHIVCPTTLFPYVRETVSDMMNRTTLPPLFLNHVDFVALYAAQKKAEQEKAGGSIITH